MTEITGVAGIALMAQAVTAPAMRTVAMIRANSWFGMISSSMVP